MGKVCEVGPLARLAVLGLVNTNSSVMSRILARVVETALLIHSMKDWLGQYEFGAPFRVPVDLPDSGTAIGRGEAPRGSLAHYVIVNEKAIQKYQVVTPTSWNCSPRDAHDVPGVLEKASAGTPVKNEKEPIEVLRVLHSFDPCMACSVH
jgi:hydrogenase large subunit